MSTPKATPRTNDGLLAVALACEHCTESVHLYGTDMKGHGADIRRVLAELAAERERVRVLRVALENLRDEQNGAPLCTRETEWKEAMDKADAALAATKEEIK